jgi:hypothetical protein
MNERIKDFYDQVGLDFENFQRVTVTKGDMEKFAELIVVEFSKQVQIEGRFGLEREQTLIRLCCENAKKHFGVEE